MLKNTLKTVNLLKTGKLTKAKPLKTRETSKGKSIDYYVRYSFETKDGPRESEFHASGWFEKLVDDEYEWILYSPLDPSSIVPLDHIQVELELDKQNLIQLKKAFNTPIVVNLLLFIIAFLEFGIQIIMICLTLEGVFLFLANLFGSQKLKL